MFKPRLVMTTLIMITFILLALFQRANAADFRPRQINSLNRTRPAQIGLSQYTIATLPFVTNSPSAQGDHAPARVVGGNSYWDDGKTTYFLQNYPATVSATGVNDKGAALPSRNADFDMPPVPVRRDLHQRVWN